ncbi:MAG TPA: DUF393 domain-containing protein [Streptosporangiaceae bacterium]|nr:DUF393 domain-containing protein [Streptosporangiaceae bacterium]
MTTTVGHARALPRPLLVYDGDCGFCASCVRFIERRIPTAAGIVPWQSVDLADLGTTRKRAEHELLWVSRAGRIDGGAQAVARLLLDARGGWAVAGALLWAPPLRWLAHLGYRLVANNRHRMPGGSATCSLPSSARQREDSQPPP